MSHTYSTLEVSNAAYQEIKRLLLAAGEDARINTEGEIDMDGVALITPKTRRIGVPSPYDLSGIKRADRRMRTIK